MQAAWLRMMWRVIDSGRLGGRSWMCSERFLWRLRAVLTVLAVVSSPALAAEHGGGEEHAAPSIWAGGLHNVIWTLIIFGSLLLVLGRFAWGPLLGALQKREEFIRNSLEQARRERHEADELLKKYTEQIDRARDQAGAILDEGRRDAETVRRRIESEARANAEDIVKRAKQDIELAHQHAVKQIYEEIAELSTRIAGQIIGREVKPEEHRQFVAGALNEIRQQGGGSSN
jgi:F-type H+-transporting ATPase subunit b